jgi:hypothetical protein
MLRRRRHWSSQFATAATLQVAAIEIAATLQVAAIATAATLQVAAIETATPPKGVAN